MLLHNQDVAKLILFFEPLNDNQQEKFSITNLRQVMTASHYSPKSIENYVREMRFLLEYYPNLLPCAITDKHTTNYRCYVKDVLKWGRDKCRDAAAAFSFTWKNVFKKPFDLPTKLYPKKGFRLPKVMTETEVARLIAGGKKP
jgi:hypothetical protein